MAKLSNTTQNRQTSDQLARTVDRFLTSVLTEIGNFDANPIDTYLEMLMYSPVVGPGFQVKLLIALSMFGEYTNEDEEKQAFIRKNFEQMNGSIKTAIAEMFMAVAVGFACSEKNYIPVGREWHLASILAIDQRRFRFQGSIGEIQSLQYYSYGDRGTIPIPYTKVVHIVNLPYLALGRDPYGVAELRRVTAVWQAWKILIGELIVAGQRQATPIIVMKVDTNESYTLFDDKGDPILDLETGQPMRIPAADRAVEQLEGLENNSVLVTDLLNEVDALNQEGGGALAAFVDVLRYLERLALLGLIIPETALSTGVSGIGDSGLNEGHMSLMLLAIGEVIDQIKEAMIEGPVRDLLEWNYGAQDDYGSFDKPEVDNTDRVALLGALSGAVQTGFFSNQDLELINKGRELAGIPPLEQIIQALKPPTPEPTTEPTNGKAPGGDVPLENGKAPANGKAPTNGKKPPAKKPAVAAGKKP